jgi:hypothetical protein
MLERSGQFDTNDSPRAEEFTPQPWFHSLPVPPHPSAEEAP